MTVGRIVTVVSLLAILCPGRGTAGQRPNSVLPHLTRIEDIRALSQDGSALGYPVRIRGIVTHFDEIAHSTLVVHDGASGQFVLPPANPSQAGDWNSLKAGDHIEIEGHTVRGGFAPNVVPDKVRKLGRAPLPPGRTIAHSAMLTGRYDCDYVEIAGVV